MNKSNAKKRKKTYSKSAGTLTAKVKFNDAQKLIEQLKAKQVYDDNYKVGRDNEYLYVPLTSQNLNKKKLLDLILGDFDFLKMGRSKQQDIIDPFSLKKVNGLTIIKTILEKKENKIKANDLIDKLLTKEERELLPKAHEIIGDILILEVPKLLKSKEKKIAEIFLQTHKQIKTIVKKKDAHSGVFRTRKVQILAGQKKKDTTYRESGLNFKVNIEQMYFSSRLANERLRVAKLVKPKENVLIMFSGAAPYVCVIAKHAQPKSVTGIEINPEAHKYAEENVKLNKLNNISLYCGDVNSIVPKLKKKYDRIAMPLPKTSEDFLPLALKHANKGGTIHYYTFRDEKDIDGEQKKINEICKSNGRKCTILKCTHVGQHAPRVWRVCYDIKVE